MLLEILTKFDAETWFGETSCSYCKSRIRFTINDVKAKLVERISEDHILRRCDYFFACPICAQYVFVGTSTVPQIALDVASKNSGIPLDFKDYESIPKESSIQHWWEFWKW